MNIHEYQAKDILRKFGVAVQRGIVADTPEKAVEAARELQNTTGTKWVVVNAPTVFRQSKVLSFGCMNSTSLPP